MTNYFKRYEKKYLIDLTQYRLLMYFIAGKMTEDKRSAYTISNLYYDTENYDLIRATTEKSVYREKLRLRMYETPGISTPSYIELKKKVDGIVYKRRFRTNLAMGIAFLGGGLCPAVNPIDQYTVKEILHFLEKNDVEPKALITYERKALHSISDPNFRMTFDSDITYKNMDGDTPYRDMERPVLEPEKMIMEIKTPAGTPVWLSKIMSELDIYPTVFSKYGMAYKTYVAHDSDRECIEREAVLSA